MPRSFFNFIKKSSSFAAMADGRLRVFALNGNMPDKVYTNLLGSAGSCENVADFGSANSTKTSDTTDKVFGNSCGKFVANANSVEYGFTKLLTVDPTKYYFLSAYTKKGATHNGTVGIMKIATPSYVGLGLNNYTPSTSWTRNGLKISPTGLNGNSSILVMATTASTNSLQNDIFLVDGVQLIEISTAESNLSNDELMQKYPYVEVPTTLYNRVGTSLALPNALPGVAVMQASGNTLVNAVKNGNFANGTAGWTVGGATLTASNNTLTVTGSGSLATPNIVGVTNAPYANGKKVFARVKVKLTNALCTNISLRIYSEGYAAYTTVQATATPTQNTDYNLQGIVTLPAGWTAGNLYAVIYSTYADAATANGKVMEVQNVMAIDLTAAQLESKTVAELNDLTQSYFEGVGSTVGATGSLLNSLSPRPLYATNAGNPAITTTQVVFTLEDAYRFKNGTLSMEMQLGKTYTVIGEVLSNNMGSDRLGFAPIAKDGASGNGATVYLPTNHVGKFAIKVMPSVENSSILRILKLNTVAGTDATKQATFSNNFIVLEGDYTAAQVNWVEKLNSAYSGPVLRNETSYNPATWAEWTTKTNVITDSTGAIFTLDGVNACDLQLPTALKPGTNYGLLFNIASNTLTTSTLYFDSANWLKASTKSFGSGVTGNQKYTFATVGTITTNKARLYVNSGPAGNAIKLQGIRVFELPPGSQIETDFNTLSADQLALKYQYFEGTTPLYGDTVVTSRGRNMVDMAKASPGYIAANGTLTAPDFDNYYSDFIKVTPSTAYNYYSKVTVPAQHAWAGAWSAVGVYDANQVFITRYGGGTTDEANLAFTTPANCYYVRTSSRFKTSGLFQLNPGTALPYQPYKFAQVKLNDCVPWQYLPLEGFNGVKDEVTAKGTVIKRSGFTVLNGSEGWTLEKTLTNNLIFTLFVTNIKIDTLGGIIPICDKFIGQLQSTMWNGDTEGCSYSSHASGKIRISISKTKATDVATFKAWLSQNNISIWYELATPVEVPLVKPFSVPTFKDGVVEITSPSILPVIDGKYRALK